MKKSLLRAVVVACLPFCALALTVATAPAYAAKSNSDGPKVSRAAGKPLGECQKLLDAKDYAGAIAKCNEVLQLSDLPDYDKYVTDRFLAMSYLGANDQPKAGEHFIAVVKNPACPEADRQNLVVPAMQLAGQSGNYNLVVELSQIALKGEITNPEAYRVIALAYFQINDLPNTALYAQKGIDLSNSKNVIPDYALYQLLTYSYEKQNNETSKMNGLTLMVRDYGKPSDWRIMLDINLEKLPGKDATFRKIAALDLYRLRLIVGAEWEATNFLEAADAADSVKAFGDVRTFLQLGIDKGVFTESKIAKHISVNNTAISKDKGVLDSVEKMVKDGKGLVSVAEAHYGYGDYTSAIRVSQKAIAAGGAYAAEAKLVQAMAQIKLGQEAEAKQTLANFSGSPSLAVVANLINVYLDRRYGKTTAPAQ